MAGETAVETPQDNTKVEETIKTDKEVIAEEEAAQANEVKWEYSWRKQNRQQSHPAYTNWCNQRVKLFILSSLIFLLSKKTIVILAEITREIRNGHRHINIY